MAFSVPEGWRSTTPRPAAAAALRAAMVSSRKSPTAPLREQRSGRIDRRSLSRLAVKDTRVFTRQASPAPKRMRVAIVLDRSGSMMYDIGGDTMAPSPERCRAVLTAQVARDLAEALAGMGNVTASIWSHTTTDTGGHTDLIRHWDTGEPTSNVDEYLRQSMNSNQDGFALQFVGETLLGEAKPDEALLIIMLSDGEPSYMVPGTRDPDPAEVMAIMARCTKPDGSRDSGRYIAEVRRAQGSAGSLHVASVAKGLRDKGIALAAVSIVEQWEWLQWAMYGKDNVIPYSPDYRVLATRMAKAIGAVMG